MSFEIEEEDFSPAHNFYSGSIAALASTAITYPLDFVRTRLSVEHSMYKNVRDGFYHIITKESFYALYNGITPALLKQLTHSATRISVYSTLEESYYLKYKKKPSFLDEFGIACISGTFSSSTGTPAEVIMNRMVADGLLRKCERRNYRSFLHAFKQIIAEEGVYTLWRGAPLGAVRATLITLTQLTTYHLTKTFISGAIDGVEEDDTLLAFCASFASGFFTTIITTPFDIAKVRLHNMRVINDKPQYFGLVDVIIKVIKREGFRSLTRGFLVDFIKTGPYTVLFLMSFDQLTEYFKNV